MKLAKLRLEAESLTAPDVKKALKAAWRFRETEKHKRPNTHGVHLQSDGVSHLRVEATNGMVMFRRDIPNCPFQADEIRKVKDGRPTEQIVGTFPDLSSIIPGTFEHVFRVNRGELLTLCELCGKEPKGGSWNVAIRTDSKGTTVVRNEWKDGSTPQDLSAVSVWDGEPPMVECYFNARYLALALKHVETDEFGKICVSTNGRFQPWFFSPDGLGEQAATGLSNWTLVMPVKPT